MEGLAGRHIFKEFHVVEVHIQAEIQAFDHFPGYSQGIIGRSSYLKLVFDAAREVDVKGCLTRGELVDAKRSHHPGNNSLGIAGEVVIGILQNVKRGRG